MSKDKKPSISKGLRTKLLSIALIPAVIVIVVLAFCVVNRLNEMRTEYETARIVNNTEAVRLSVQNALNSVKDTVISGNQSMTVRNYFSTLTRRHEMMLNSNYEDVKLELEAMVAGCDMARSAWIVDYDTNVAFRNPSRWWRSDENWRLDTRPYYLRLSTGWRTIFTEPYQGDGVSGTTISTVMPVMDTNGAALGVVGVDLDINQLALTLYNAGKSHAGTAILITGDGNMVEYKDGKGIINKSNTRGLEYNLLNAISLKNPGNYYFTHDNSPMLGRLELVENTDDWMILFMMPEDVLDITNKASVAEVVHLFVGFGIGLALVYFIWITRVTKRAKLAQMAADRVFAGETEVEFPAITQDETGLMARAANIIVDKLGAISYAADRYTALIVPAVQKSEEDIKQLSSNTADNAYSVMDIADSLRNISYNLSANAKGANHTGDRAQSVMKELNENGRRLGNMITAAHQTKSAISEIQKSVKIIEEIAFQTHILSLSANVEASAMEDADSSSFKVIAEEVRELARQSTGSASRTKELIVKASEHAQQCVDLSDEASRSLMITTDEANNIVESIAQISRLSKEDARALTDLMSSADHLSGKVNDNSNVAARCAELMEDIARNALELREVLNSLKQDTHSADE